ncbi:hypothetical protein [Bacillus sp. EAC]|uniref:hypothetical protein n=1 Tax=Bacillus sp. EAC TaxID=1978338 RepID=UPI0015C51804|nr:hypothetical protein [Bacillus sp. EAC]
MELLVVFKVFGYLFLAIFLGFISIMVISYFQSMKKLLIGIDEKLELMNKKLK